MVLIVSTSNVLCLVSLPVFSPSSLLEVQLVLVDNHSQQTSLDNSSSSSRISSEDEEDLHTPSGTSQKAQHQQQQQHQQQHQQQGNQLNAVTAGDEDLAAAAVAAADKGPAAITIQLLLQPHLKLQHSRSQGGCARVLLGVGAAAIAATLSNVSSSSISCIRGDVAVAVGGLLIQAVEADLGRRLEEVISWRSWFDQERLGQLGAVDQERLGFVQLVQGVLQEGFKRGGEGGARGGGPVVQGVPVLGLWCGEFGECCCVFELLIGPKQQM